MKWLRPDRSAELQVYSDVMRPTFDQISRDIGDVAIQAALDEKRVSRANNQLIRSFSERLPAAEGVEGHLQGSRRNGFYRFQTDTLAEVKQLQSHVIWRYKEFPWYMVGQQIQDAKYTNLMLLNAIPSWNGEAHVGIMRVKTKDAHTLQDGMSSACPYSEAEVDKIYNSEADKFLLAADSPRNLTIKQAGWWTDEQRLPDIYPSDQMMEDFNVYSHLYELATAFGQEDSLSELFAERERTVQAIFEKAILGDN